jgi:E3 ubiquitin-protein ligase UBR7
MSLEELGLRALERSVPRERAIDGIHAFNAMKYANFPAYMSNPLIQNPRDKLIQHLKPFATEGRAVEETDIRGFFETLKEQQGKHK